MIKIFFVIIISSLLFAACCTCSINRISDIPVKLIETSNAFIISKTGEDFFNKYINLNYGKVTKTNTGYLMVYNFSIPKKEGVGGEIRFSIDSLGNVLKDKEIAGIPECFLNPRDCSFFISKGEAKEIAKQNELDEGIKDWKINLKWSSKYKKYCWEVISTISESKSSDIQRANVKTMLINPGDGNILETNDWRIN